MQEEKYSNCHLEAWRNYRKGNAIGFCFYPTQYSKAQKIVSHPIMFPVRLFGIILQWIAHPLTHLGEYLRSGKWYHLHWMDENGDHWEFVPVPSEQKRKLWFSPLIFRGFSRKINQLD